MNFFQNLPTLIHASQAPFPFPSPAAAAAVAAVAAVAAFAAVAAALLIVTEILSDNFSKRKPLLAKLHRSSLQRFFFGEKNCCS